MRAYRSGFAALVSFTAVFYIFLPAGPSLREPSYACLQLGQRLDVGSRGCAEWRGSPPPYTLGGAHASAPGMRISARRAPGCDGIKGRRWGVWRGIRPVERKCRIRGAGGGPCVRRKRAASCPAPSYFWGQPTGARVPPSVLVPLPPLRAHWTRPGGGALWLESFGASCSRVRHRSMAEPGRPRSGVLLLPAPSLARATAKCAVSAVRGENCHFARSKHNGSREIEFGVQVSEAGCLVAVLLLLPRIRQRH